MNMKNVECFDMLMNNAFGAFSLYNVLCAYLYIYVFAYRVRASMAKWIAIRHFRPKLLWRCVCGLLSF